MKRKIKSTTLHHAVAFFFLLNCAVVDNKGHTLKTIKFEAGDQVRVPISQMLGRTLSPSLHFFFAVSDSELFNIAAYNLRMTKTLPNIVVRDNLPDKLLAYKAKLVKADPTKPRLKLSQAVALARRMRFVMLPYNLLQCNCRHYSDFLTYGKTYGSYLNPAYEPMNKKCPFAIKIDNTTNVNDPNFVLRDMRNRTYTLNLGP